MPYRFIFSTWLMIIPMNIIAVILALFINNRIEASEFPLTGIDLNADAVLMIALFSLPFATPGLFGLMIAVWIAREFIPDAAAQYRFIAAACCFITIGCYTLMELVLQLNFETRDYIMLITASMSAVALTLAFTRRYYYSYIRSLT
jgi:hypothetical protein